MLRRFPAGHLERLCYYVTQSTFVPSVVTVLFTFVPRIVTLLLLYLGYRRYKRYKGKQQVTQQHNVQRVWPEGLPRGIVRLSKGKLRFGNLCAQKSWPCTSYTGAGLLGVVVALRVRVTMLYAAFPLAWCFVVPLSLTICCWCANY